MSSTNSVVNRSTNTSNVSGLGSVSGTDGGGIVYKPIKPTVGTHIPKVPGMKKPGRVGFGWIADLSVVVQMLKSAGIEADDDDDPRTLFQSLNRARTAQQIAVADKMAKLTGTSIDRNTMLSDFQNAIDANTNAAKEWSDYTEEIADRLHAVKQNVLSKIWKDGGTRTDRANDMVSQWSKQKMDQHAGSSPGEPATPRPPYRSAPSHDGTVDPDFDPFDPKHWPPEGEPGSPEAKPKPLPRIPDPYDVEPTTPPPDWTTEPPKVDPRDNPYPELRDEPFPRYKWPGPPEAWDTPGLLPDPLTTTLPPDIPIQTPKRPQPPWWWPFVLIPISPLNPFAWPYYASKVDTEVE